MPSTLQKMSTNNGARNGIDDRRRGDARGGSADDRRHSGPARRRAPRMRTLKGAQIVVPAGTAIRCIVRNISETGACLEMATPAFLSHTFDLAFDDPDWAHRACRVVWRNGPLMGVAFEAPESEDGPIRRAIRRLLGKSSG